MKPNDWFWRIIRIGRLKPESAILHKGLSLVDGRPKPVHRDIKQRYKDDEFMEDLIKGLRLKGKIQRNAHVPIYSRFEVSPWEIEKEIMPELTRAIGKKVLGSEGRVVNNPLIIFNITGNMRYPKWGKTNTREWFGDKLVNDTPMTDVYLSGGYSTYGGLADVFDGQQGNRANYFGFRPWITFSSTT